MLKFIRSSWKRRRSSVNKKNTGDGCDFKTMNKSLEYIMEPKDLHRPASESRHHQTPTSCCSECQGSKKITVKSLSMTSISQISEIHTVDLVTTQDGDKIRPTSTISPSEATVSSAKTVKPPKKGSSKSPTRDISCQCNAVVANVQSQYDSKSCGTLCTTPQIQLTKETETITTTEPHATASPCCDCRKPVPKHHAQLCLNCYCPSTVDGDTVCCDSKICPTRESSMQQEAAKQQPTLGEHDMATELAQQEKTPDQTETPRRVTKLPRDSVELLEVKRFTKSKTSFLAISRSGTAQTSDHSINLGEGTQCYPFFMKIIYADKLDEKVNKRNL